MKHYAPPALRFLQEALDSLARDGILRQRPIPVGSDTITFCSNDYLGLARRHAVGDAPVGAGASRLVAGERVEHRDLEREVARLFGVESSLVFSSGYAANLGALAALAQPGDLLVSDALNHASIIDGARLSRANVVVTPHLDVGAVQRALRLPRQGGRAWVVTESYFSMDADSPDLAALRAVCDAEGAGLIVDEAHALGVLGPDGRGLCADAGVLPDVLIGTFGKAFGAAGAFVAGCDVLTRWLWNRARPFVFSTGLSPATAAAARAALQLATKTPLLRERVASRAEQFRAGLRRIGVLAAGHSHVVPWVVGPSDRALRLAAELCGRGVFVQAIRPPSVPPDAARLRFTLTALHTSDDVERALGAIVEAIRCAPP